MANPNIVSVTSIYGESIGEALTTTTTTAIMTVASSALVKINYITIANDDSSTAVACTVCIDKADFTSAGAVTFLDGATDVDVAQHDGSNGLKLGGTLVTQTAAQINGAASTGKAIAMAIVFGG